NFNRFNIEEKIAIILIKRTDIVPSLRIIIQALIHFFFIINFPFVYAERFSQDFIIVYIVTRKGDISIIILLTLFYIQINIDGIGIKGKYRITYDFRIPIAARIIKIDHALLIIAKVTTDKLRSV